MEDSTDNLNDLLLLRLSSARELDELLATPKYAKLQGSNKLRNRLASELRFLEGLEDGRTPLERKYIETSNVTHFSNLVSAVERFDDVTSLFHTFSILDPETEQTLKHTVDVVAKKGLQWIKVISRSAKGICMDWLAGSSRNIFEQAETYLAMASLFQRNFSAPEVTFEFMAGVPDKMASRLSSMGICVVGPQVPLDSVANVPEDFLELLEDVDNSNSDSELDTDSEKQPAVNLDVSAVFVLISNLTHPGGTNHRFDSTLLKQQAEMEKLLPARQQLIDQIKGRDLIICRTAYDSVRSIASTVGGATERERMEELLKDLKVVDDQVSERTQLLKHSERVNERSMVIFGSGDYYRAVTATANKHFVSSAYHQGVSYDVLLHESRALSEQKELPLLEKSE